MVVICSKFITFAVTKTIPAFLKENIECCDLLKIHYLCGDKDNANSSRMTSCMVVICSKFITFAVTKTISPRTAIIKNGCDLLKIHYLCGDKDNYK